jgi:hypothetical protein
MPQGTESHRDLTKGQRRVLLLLLIGAPGSGNEVGEPIFGTTRLQKLLFLLKHEYSVERYLQAYNFEAFRYGPFAKELYDDLEFLENLGLIRAQPFGPQTHQEEWEEDVLDKNLYLTFEEEAEAEAPQGRAYRLTERGSSKYNALQAQLRDQGIDVDSLLAAISEVKSAFGEMPLTQLISYVYGQYPDYAEQSQLKHLK